MSRTTVNVMDSKSRFEFADLSFPDQIRIIAIATQAAIKKERVSYNQDKVEYYAYPHASGEYIAWGINGELVNSARGMIGTYYLCVGSDGNTEKQEHNN